MSSMGKRNAIIVLAFFIFALSLFSFCAPNIKHYPQINQYLLCGDYGSAYNLVKENKDSYKERNAVLYYLDEGIVSHFAGLYQESNESLSRAESLMEELYTKSISKEAASFFINDNTVPYGGEDFERAMVNLFMGLNYVGMGRWEDALVEARKVDNTLSIINSQYEEDKKNVYKEDGFIRFLMGTLYEVDDAVNDAFISYRKAEEIYENQYFPNYGVSPPTFLLENLLISAKAMDFSEELGEIKEKYPDVLSMNPAKKKEMAEVFFIHYNGLGPEKVGAHFTVPMPDGYLFTIAYPKFVKKSYRIDRGEITLRDKAFGKSYSFPTVLMDDIASIAVENLDNRINRIKAKAIARATIKYLASREAGKAAEKEGGALLGWVVKTTANIASIATEQADIRQWRLLPAEIRVGRAMIPQGEYSGRIDFVSSGGAVVSSREVLPFSVKKRGKRYFIYRTLE
ncbi:MAG TPA: hypothetical protein VMW42_02395 [Desulfatiglandales bacterium]|nr:hypothetical protein [Desulfatiglandales bacterium]